MTDGVTEEISEWFKTIPSKTADEAANYILKHTDGATRDTDVFVSWDGAIIPW
jgi:hypothetical protein